MLEHVSTGRSVLDDARVGVAVGEERLRRRRTDTNVFHQSRVSRRRRTRKLRDFRALHRLTAAARRVGRVWGRPRVSRQARWVIQSGRSSPTTCSSPAAPRAGTASSPATCRCSVGSDEPTPPTFARATRAARGPRCRRMKPVRARNARTRGARCFLRCAHRREGGRGRAARAPRRAFGRFVRGEEDDERLLRDAATRLSSPRDATPRAGAGANLARRARRDGRRHGARAQGEP